MERKILINYNYLTELLDIIEKEEAVVDYIKYPSVEKSDIEELETLANKVNNKILFHGVMSNDDTIINLSDRDLIDRIDIQKTKKAIELSRNNYLSIHISQDDSEEVLKDLTKEEILSLIKKNSEFIKDNFKEVEIFSLENREYGTIFEDSTFFTEALNISGFDFLLDISHAINSAKLFNIPIIDYLNSLPLDKVYEIHTNGWVFEEKFESHLKMNDECYYLIEYLIKNTKLELITIEHSNYSKEYNYKRFTNFDEDDSIIREEILEQLNKINELVKKVS